MYYNKFIDSALSFIDIEFQTMANNLQTFYRNHRNDQIDQASKITLNISSDVADN